MVSIFDKKTIAFCKQFVLSCPLFTLVCQMHDIDIHSLHTPSCWHTLCCPLGEMHQNGTQHHAPLMILLTVSLLLLHFGFLTCNISCLSTCFCPCALKMMYAFDLVHLTCIYQSQYCVGQLGSITIVVQLMRAQASS